MSNQLLLIFCIKYLLFLLNYGLSVCNASPWIGKKVQPAGENEFPFVVSFSRKMHFGLEGNHLCTGSLISKVHIITAAHCFPDGTKLSNIVINIGSNKLGSGDRYDIDSVMTYQEWANESRVICAYDFNDLIVVTSTEEVIGIEPGIISLTKDKDNYGKEAISVGWGAGNDGTIEEYLQKVYLKILNMKECENRFCEISGQDLEAQWNYLCTIGRDSAIIIGGGDSGGPLIDVNTKKIIGVNGSGYAKNKTEFWHQALNAHLSIDYYRHFIKHFIPKCHN